MCPSCVSDTTQRMNKAPVGFKSNYSNYLDVTEEYMGIVAGYGNTLGTMASIVGPKITAATLERTNQNWNLVL